MFVAKASVLPNNTGINPCSSGETTQMFNHECMYVCVCVWSADMFCVVYYLSSPLCSFVLLTQQFPQGRETEVYHTVIQFRIVLEQN